MEESVREVEMMYIKNPSGDNYTVETMGRRSTPVKLNFSNVEGVEFNAANKPLEIKNSFLQMKEGEPKIWNLRFGYPTNFSIKFMGKIIIEVI